MRKRNYKPKFFPFSAGISWKIDRGKYIIPETDYNTWQNLFTGKDIIVVSFGGLIESFFSLSCVEVFKRLSLDNNIYWIGNPEFSFFVRAQGLCKVSNINITKSKLSEYPVPIFFDKNSNVYFNILNNYLVRKSYWGKYPDEIKLPVFQQIANNITIPWDNYIPILRNIDNVFFNKLIKSGRIKKKTKVVSIILNDNSNDIMGWNIHNIREFVQLMSIKRIKVIIFTKETYKYHGLNCLVFNYSLNNIIQAIIKSWMVLSNDIDWLLISLIISDAHLISKHIDGPFNLFANAEFIDSSNDIFTDREGFLPIDIFNICEGLL